MKRVNAKISKDLVKAVETTLNAIEYIEDKLEMAKNVIEYTQAYIDSYKTETSAEETEEDSEDGESTESLNQRRKAKKAVKAKKAEKATRR